MRPRPSVVTTALFVLAAIHAWWGVKILLASSVLMGGSQLMSAGALVFDLALRAAAAFVIAVFVDAPPVRAMRRNGFAGDASSAPR